MSSNFCRRSWRNSLGRLRYNLTAKKALQRQSSTASLGQPRASSCHFCHVPEGEVDWHNPPQHLLVLNLTGGVEYETSDGDVRRLTAGSVVLAEDTTGKGHITRFPPEGQLVEAIGITAHGPKEYPFRLATRRFIGPSRTQGLEKTARPSALMIPCTS